MSFQLPMGFPGSSMVKNPPANAGDAGDMGSIPGSGRSHGEGNGNPLQYSCLENLHGQKSLAGYSPCGYKESDMTEHTHTVCTTLLISLFIPALPSLSLFYCGQIYIT